MSASLLVLGGGLAGLTAAIAAAEAGLEVSLHDDGGFSSSASVQAQGGFSAVTAAGIATGDSVASHAADTLEAGARHGDAAVIAAVCEAAAGHVETLSRWGTAWDIDAQGNPSLTREAAHAADRILHCGGDATGAGLVLALRARAEALQEQGRLVLRGRWRAAGLEVQGGAVTGVFGTDGALHRADAVLLASGGMSGVYETRTSRYPNPGDAAALAFGAGAVLSDAEMVQFHPTYCFEAGFMISEALRGEGAVLRDALGRRFMLDLDPRAELAPRDVVARGVASAEGGAWLDATPIVDREGAGFLARRFPTITAELARAGFDLKKGPVPVRPAQHYWMGGIAVDQHARTTLPGLLAAGEAARTGLHGANRLASNSLLEAVHGALAAVATVAAGRQAEGGAPHVGQAIPLELSLAPGPDVATVRRIADVHLGVDRSEAGLRAALDQLAEPAPTPHPADRSAAAAEPSAPSQGTEAATPSSEGTRTAALARSSEALVARLIATAALLRPASLGAHHRVDSSEAPRPGVTVSLVNAHPDPSAPEASLPTARPQEALV